MEFENLVKEIEKTGNNGAVMFKLDNNKKVTHISPLCQVDSIEELYCQLRDVELAIHSFLEVLVNKGLSKN